MPETYCIEFDVGMITDEFVHAHRVELSRLLTLHDTLLLLLASRYDADTTNQLEQDDDFADDVYYLPALPGAIARIIVSSPLLASPEEVSDLVSLVNTECQAVQSMFPRFQLRVNPYPSL